MERLHWMRTISSRVWYTCTKIVGSWSQSIIPSTVFSSQVRISPGITKMKSNASELSGSTDCGSWKWWCVCMCWCLCPCVEPAVCCRLFCAATGCSLWVFIPFLISSWGIALVDGLVHVSGSALWGTMEMVLLKLFFISWRMFLESGNQTLPADVDRLPWLSTHLVWLWGGFWWFCSGTGGILAVLLHSGCSQVSSHMVSLQSGPVCGLALPDGHSGADSVSSPCCWTQGCCCGSIYSIYLELLSALQLLLTQMNVSFLSLYFLQCWHVAVLQSVGAVLSLELRNNFSPQFPGNSRPPPHWLPLLQRLCLFCASAS